MKNILLPVHDGEGREARFKRSGHHADARRSQSCLDVPATDTPREPAEGPLTMLLRHVFRSLGLGCVLLFALAATQGRAGAARWDSANIAAMHDIIRSARDEGLDPGDYWPIERVDAPPSDPVNQLDTAALKLAQHYAEGKISLRQRPGWHFTRPAMDYRAWLDRALAGHRLEESFRALLPSRFEYAALRTALARCRARHADCLILEINLDRWRALPRVFGSRYLWVNVPAQRLDLIDNGRVMSSHKVIIGKPRTATPLFGALVTGVTANPWWNVPCSIVEESIGKLVRTNPRGAARRGYVASVDRQGKLVVRQKPGPGNALGRLKLEMPNPYGVYIHDTSTRELFAREARALSHGCVRADQPEALAKALLGERWSTFDQALLLGRTETVKLPAPVPVYVVYLTAEADESAVDGATYHQDIYKRDRPPPAGPR